MNRSYKVVDVFSKEHFLGNPVAVVLDGEGLKDEEMQAIARWINLSETTFVMPSTDAGADYKLRIFALTTELPFAGHPTLGTAHAVLEAGLFTPTEGKLVQECAKGLVSISVEVAGDERRLTFELPPAEHRLLTGKEIDELNAILGHIVLADPAPAVVDVGAVWIVAEISDVDSLLGIAPDLVRCADFERRLGAIGVSLYAVSDTGIETRSFPTSTGVNEDPVCGSGNGCVASFRLRAAQIREGDGYIARQGRMTGRDGFVSIRIASDGAVMVGGACVTTIEGVLNA